MKKRTIAILGTLSLSVIAFLWLGNNNNIEPLDECKSNEELKVYCDFMNPEDLALTPDGNFLIVAEFGGMAPLVEMTSGKLSFFNIENLHNNLCTDCFIKTFVTVCIVFLFEKLE